MPQRTVPIPAPLPSIQLPLRFPRPHEIVRFLLALVLATPTNINRRQLRLLLLLLLPPILVLHLHPETNTRGSQTGGREEPGRVQAGHRRHAPAPGQAKADDDRFGEGGERRGGETHLREEPSLGRDLKRFGWSSEGAVYRTFVRN